MPRRSTGGTHASGPFTLVVGFALSVSQQSEPMLCAAIAVAGALTLADTADTRRQTHVGTRPTHTHEEPCCLPFESLASALMRS